MIRFLLLSARKDLKRRLADPVSIGIWFGIPLLLGSMLSTLGGGNDMPRAKVLLVDQDDSLVSDLITGDQNNMIATRRTPDTRIGRERNATIVATLFNKVVQPT